MHSIIKEQASALTELCRRFHVRRLALFGSSLTRHFDPQSSDLDFLVEFEAIPAGQRSRTYFGLLEQLEALFGRPVDLVEASAVRNPYVKRQIEATQETLYGA